MSAIPAAVLSLTDKSQMSLTMGFMNDGPRVMWDIKEIWWNRDDRKIAAVGLWRRERPPGSAKLDLRTKFASMRDRRSPYDGKISHETTEEFAASRVLDVPGKKSGTISSDLLYGVTLHLDGLPAHNDSDPIPASGGGGDPGARARPREDIPRPAAHRLGFIVNWSASPCRRDGGGRLGGSGQRPRRRAWIPCWGRISAAG